jgi:hypothetical protein
MSVPTTLLTADNDRAFTDWAQSVTYRRITASTNYQTGTSTETPADAPVDALVSQITQRMVNQSGGRYQAGDRVFRIKVADLPETPPKRTSSIVHLSKVYQIVGHEEGDDELNSDVVARMVTQ